VARLKEQAALQALLLENEKESLTRSARYVQLLGAPGMGKSSIVCSAASFMQERALFDGGVIYLNLREVTSY
jgi:predicted ATPase